MRRNELDVTSQAVRNILTNPALETANTTKDLTIRTNLFTNPGMRNVSVTPQVVRTNLITNPSMANGGAVSAVRTNLVNNPSVEYSTSGVGIRTNLASSPRGISTLNAYSSTITATPNVAISNGPEGISTAMRVQYTTQPNPGVSILDAPEASMTYAMSAWVYHESTMSTIGSQGFAQAGVQSSPAPIIETGKWVKISWVYTTSGTSNIGFRVSSAGGTGTGSFLITGMIIEKSFVNRPFFDGSTTTLNLVPNPSMDGSTGTTTVRKNYVLNPSIETGLNNIAVAAGTGGTVNVTRETTGGYNGTSFARATWTVGSTGIGGNFENNPSVGFTVGTPISESVYVRVNNPQRLQLIITGTANVTVISNPIVDVPANTWTRLTITGTVSVAGNANMRIAPVSGGFGRAWVAGDTMDTDCWLMEATSAVGSYFDGSTAVSGDFTCSWDGTANNSTSSMRAPNAASWGSQWYGNGGGTGYMYRATGAGISGGYAARKVWTSDNTTSALDVGITTTISVAPSATYTSSIYQKSSFASVLTCYVIWKDVAGTTISVSPRTAYTTTPAGAWVRASCTETAPAGASTGTFVYGPYTGSGTIPAGSTIDWDWCLVEETDKLNPYYDGSGLAPNDFTYLWNGAVNSSSSMQRANYPSTFGVNTQSAKIWQAQQFGYHGFKSISVESVAATGFSNGMNFTVANVPAGTYTYSAYVYLNSPYGTSGIGAVAGTTGGLTRGSNVTTIGSWQRTSVTFTVPSTQTVWLYLITDGASTADIGSRFYADAFMLEATSDLRNYFDGTNNTLNLIANPSFEVNSNGWQNAGNPVATVTRDIAPVYSGVGVLRVTCDGAVVNQGAFTPSRPSVRPSRWYTASVWIRGDAGKSVRLELGEWDEGANIVGGGRVSSANITLNGDWQRLTVSKLMGPTASTVDIVVRNVNAVAHTFYIDAAMFEEGNTASDYPNASFTFAWTGTPNNSSSEQRATTVAGITYTSPVQPYQSSERSIYGPSSLYLEGSSGDIAYQTFAGPTVSGLTVGTTYTLSAWVYLMPGSVGVELQPSGVGAVTSGRSTTTGKWERIYQTFSAATTSHILRVRTVSNGKVQIYIGAMLLEQGATLLPYFDAANPALENIAGTTIAQSVGTTITPNVSFNGMLWSRATTVTGTGALLFRNIVNQSKLIPGVPYTASVTVANDQANPVYVSIDWCDMNTVGYTLAPGETKRLSTTGTGLPGRGYDAVYRFADLNVSQNSTEQKSVLFKDWLIEQGSVVNNYYSGTGDYTYAWTGTANASASNQRVFPLIGQQLGKSGADPNARFWAYSSTDETGNKVAKWLSPAGTPNSSWRVAGWSSMDYASIVAGRQYTMYIRYRASGWAPSAQAPVQLSDGSNLNQVIGAATGYSLNLGVPGWQTYRRTFTALINGLASTWVYLNLPVTPDPLLDGTLEVSEAFLVENSHSGAYFDGSTVSSDPDISYAWNGAVDASTSKMLGSSITGIANNPAYAQGIVSTSWKSSGTKSMRILSKNVSNPDSFVDISGMIRSSDIKPNTKYTIAGTRYISAPLTGTISSSPGFRAYIGSTELAMAYKAGYSVNNSVAGASRVVATFTTGSATNIGFIRLQHGGTEGVGDVWWDDLLLVEGDYDGRHVDGTMPNARWDGTAHASTSVGYPTTLEGLVGMPLFSATTGGNWALDSSKLLPTGARTFYTVAESKPLSTGGIDVIWVYGQDSLSDNPVNQSITYRYQSESTGNSNSILSRRTGGSGAIRAGVPSPARYIMTGGVDENGYLFAGHPGAPTVATDNLKMSIPHERFQVYADNATHTHIATYMYAGVHDAATRALVYKLLAQRHNVPLLV